MQREARRLTIPRWALAAMGYALLIGAWAFANPPSAAPDEPAHVIRAAAAGEGQWVGRPVAPYQRAAGLTPQQAEYLNAQTQRFNIPARSVLPGPCFTSNRGASAACLNYLSAPDSSSSARVTVTSYATTAPPYFYALAGGAMLVQQDVLKPIYLGRLALALVCALLLAGAAWAASGHSSLWPAAGLALAATPMVVFLASSLTPVGVALSAALCFGSAVFAMWMDRPRFGLLGLISLSGVALALARPSGLVYLAAVMVVAVPLLQLRWIWRPAVLFPFLVAGAGVVIEVTWILSHQPSLPPGGSFPLDSLPVVAQRGADIAGQLVGLFGVSDVPLHPVLVGVWQVMVALLVATAVFIGRWRDRFALVFAAAAAVLVAAALYALILAPVGWDLQGRYVLAVAALLPLLGGFVLYHAGLPPRLDASLVGLVVGGIQFGAFWLNARRYAVGENGPLDFVGVAQWAPPGGWGVWLVAAGLGAALIALSLAPLTAAEREEAGRAAMLGDSGLVSVSR